MNTETATPPPATGLPAYLEEMQIKAVKLQALVQAMVFLETEDDMTGARVTIGEYASDLARDLNLGLDPVNLPSGVLS